MSQLLGRIGLAPGAHALRLPHVVQDVLLVSAGYYAGGIVGILLEFPPSGIAAIWPPKAILLAALLLTPPRCWWIYLLAVVPTHLHLVANFWRLQRKQRGESNSGSIIRVVNCAGTSPRPTPNSMRTASRSA
jgi:hypothetical protein